MAFVPGCEKDVFISYAHDNDHDGWVTRFQRVLTTKLIEYLGARERPAVWFDDRNLRAGDPVASEIHRVLDRTAALVSVISPSYVTSHYCVHDELEHFWRKSQATSRVIIQALKVPLRPGQRMPLSDVKYVEFLERLENGDVEELDAGDPRFNRLLNKVAYQLGTHLEEMRRKRQSVFVADPQAPELFECAQVLRAELHGHGYHVPDDRVAAFTDVETIRGLIDSCSLSVHFFSGPVDDLPERRQMEIAKAIGKPMVVAALVPMDTSGFPGSCGDPVMIGRSGNGALPAVADDWKHRVVDQIRKRLMPPEPVDQPETRGLEIYVSCENKAALGDAADLIDAIRDKGMEVLRPDFRVLDPARQAHDRAAKLGRSQGVVYFAAQPDGNPAPQNIIVAECPVSSPSRAGVFAIDENLTGLDAFLDAATRRHTARAEAGGARS
jgi:hypothetical protein